jgi:hypothetical protein
MRRALLWPALMLVALCSGSRSVEAGPFDRTEKKVDALLGDMKEALSRLATIRDRTTGVPDLVSTLGDSRAATQAAGARAFLEATRTQAEEFLARERERFVAFVQSDDPAVLRRRLKGCVMSLRDLANAYSDVMGCVEIPCFPVLDRTLTFARLLEAIDRVPAAALYPLHLADEVLSEMDGELRPLIDCLRDHLLDGRLDLCAVLQDDESTAAVVADPQRLSGLRTLVKVLRRASSALNKVGAKIEAASKDLDFSFEVGLWGFVLGEVNPGTIEGIGKRVQSLGARLQALADWIKSNLNQWELMAATRTLAANQQLILDRLQALEGAEAQR